MCFTLTYKLILVKFAKSYYRSSVGHIGCWSNKIFTPLSLFYSVHCPHENRIGITLRPLLAVWPTRIIDQCLLVSQTTKSFLLPPTFGRYEHGLATSLHMSWALISLFYKSRQGKLLPTNVRKGRVCRSDLRGFVTFAKNVIAAQGAFLSIKIARCNVIHNYSRQMKYDLVEIYVALISKWLGKNRRKIRRQ